MLLSDIPALAAHHWPDADALRFEGRRMSFTQLRDRCWQLSDALAGIAAWGDRIAILAENCPEYVEAYYGVPGAGMALTLLNYRLSARELTYILNDNAPTAIIVERKYLPVIRQIRGEIPSLKHIILIEGEDEGVIAYEALVAQGRAVEPVRRPEETDMAWLLYTSGTTGLPKGAMLSHRNLIAGMSNALATPTEERMPGVYLMTFPQFHVAGFAVPVHHVRGYMVVLLRSFDAQALLSAIAEHRVTSTGMAPTMMAMLLEDPDADRYDLSSIQLLSYGASAMPAEVLRRFTARWPNIGFKTGFGMTELSGNVMQLTALDHRRAQGEGLDILRSVGRQMPLARVRVIDDADQDTPPGVPGEIIVKGDQVLTGYWGKPEATAASFIDGWFRTGDVGRWDEHGYLTIVDRKKDMILTGGENVYPREVEEILHEHPAVAEAAVVGASDPKWGEKIVAVIRLRAGEAGAEDEIIAFCKARIASYKKPRHVVFVDELPKNASGKILKRQLRDEIASGALVLSAG